MNHHQRQTLHSLFAHPISANISMQEVESVLKHLGAEIDNRHKARIGVKLNGHTAVFHTPQHHLARDEVTQIRKFIESCGIDPARDYPL
ncbi:MAG: hypothetical protein JNK67_11650 [Alphaproteobacteria bacterium]|nr:hypothetical protein [Alphaproteobacteria bacterium]